MNSCRVYISSIGLILLNISSYSQSAIAYYNFDNNPKDHSGNNNNGSIIGNLKLVADRFGNSCGAYYFDGFSYIEVPNSNSISSITDAFTFSVWYKFDNKLDNTWLTVLCKGQGLVELPENPQFRMQIQQNTAVVVNSCSPYSPSGSSTLSVNTAFTKCDIDFGNHLFEESKWGYYALVYDGKEIRAYMNGRIVFKQDYYGGFHRNNSSLFIGKDDPGNIEYFVGSLDDLFIYNRALSEQEIRALYNSAKPANTLAEDFTISSLDNQVVEIPWGVNETRVDFSDPVVSKSPCGQVTLKQVRGLKSGSSFKTGRHLITYEGKSSMGYTQHSSFYVIVITPPTPPIVSKPVPAKDTTVAIVKLEPLKKDTAVVVKPPPRKDTTVTISKPLEPAKKDTIVIIKPPFIKDSSIVKIDQPEPKQTSLPPDLTARKNKELGSIDIKSNELRGILYDNGVFDRDTVTIILNKTVVFSGQEVNTKGKSFKIDIDTTLDVNELIMYAENEGSIPPNTALLILYDGDVRHEINLLSTLSTNGTIRLRRKK